MVMFILCLEWPCEKNIRIFSTNEANVNVAIDSVLGSTVSSENYYVIHQGKRVGEEDIKDGGWYHVVPRMLGGKGGFGSMLRALGAQIEKTTNREACRDLSGRRMRDVNNEKKLREWAAKAGEREKEKQEKRKEKRERMMAPKRFKEEDKEYEEQRERIAKDLDDAFAQGLKKVAAVTPSTDSPTAGCSSSSSKKRKAVPSATEVDPKKSKPWIGMDEESSSDESVDQMLSSTAESSNTSDDAVDQFPNMAEADKVKLTETNIDPSTDQQKHDSTAPAADAIGSSASTLDVEQIVQSLDLNLYNSAKDLCSLGLDVLKAALMARGMKCGGTLTERAERLFSVKGMGLDQIPPALLAKTAKKK